MLVSGPIWSESKQKSNVILLPASPDRHRRPPHHGQWRQTVTSPPDDPLGKAVWLSRKSRCVTGRGFEFLHASSLLHDDVVDNAEFRRSQPAANVLWGNQGVVLVGDFLYSKSILMTVAYNNIRILQALSEATTLMAEGEVLQLIHADNLEIVEQEYLEVITRKTAALISAACQIGAILGGAEATQEKALRAYGHNLGIAFQLIDDTLDYTGDVNELGKPVGNDIQQGRPPCPSLLPSGTAARWKRSG